VDEGVPTGLALRDLGSLGDRVERPAAAAAALRHEDRDDRDDDHGKTGTDPPAAWTPTRRLAFDTPWFQLLPHLCRKASCSVQSGHA
jgi:hypothetical protein